MADNINVKGPAARIDAAAAAMPQAGDIVSKLQKYLAGKGVSSKKAAKLLADAIDDFMEEEDTAAEADVADELLEQLQTLGVPGKNPEEIADALARMLDGPGHGSPEELERFLRGHIDARLRDG